MTTLEFFRHQFQSERRKFASVIRAMPSDQLDYKPHQRNSSAGDIAWFLVLELRGLAEIARTGDMHWKQDPNPKSLDAIVTAYEAAADDLERTVASLSEEQWEQPARMFVGAKLIKTSTIGETLWDFFFDAIHHRGQLTAYLRPMGGKIPSIYGPTADTE